MLGCDMVSESDDRLEFVIRNEQYGAKMVYIAPEAGRQSGEYSTPAAIITTACWVISI